MKVMISNQDLLNAGEALKGLSQEKFPVKTSYRIGKLAVKVEAKVKEFQKARMEVFKQLGTLDEATKHWNVDKDNQEEFSKTMERLLEKLVEFEFFPIEADMLKGAIITPEQVNGIILFVEGDLE